MKRPNSSALSSDPKRLPGDQQHDQHRQQQTLDPHQQQLKHEQQLRARQQQKYQVQQQQSAAGRSSSADASSSRYQHERRASQHQSPSGHQPRELQAQKQQQQLGSLNRSNKPNFSDDSDTEQSFARNHNEADLTVERAERRLRALQQQQFQSRQKYLDQQQQRRAAAEQSSAQSPETRALLSRSKDEQPQHDAAKQEQLMRYRQQQQFQQQQKASRTGNAPDLAMSRHHRQQESQLTPEQLQHKLEQELRVRQQQQFQMQLMQQRNARLSSSSDLPPESSSSRYQHDRQRQDIQRQPQAHSRSSSSELPPDARRASIKSEQEHHRQQELQRLKQQELHRQREQQRQYEQERQQELHRLRELHRQKEQQWQQDPHRQHELQRLKELHRQKELQWQQEQQEQEEVQRQQEHRRQMKLLRQQELQRQQEQQQQHEPHRHLEQQRHQDPHMLQEQQEQRRQQKLLRQQELQRQQEQQQQQDPHREQERRQQNLLRQEELQRQNELQRQQEPQQQQDPHILQEQQRQQKLVQQQELQRQQEQQRQKEAAPPAASPQKEQRPPEPSTSAQFLKKQQQSTMKQQDPSSKAISVKHEPSSEAERTPKAEESQPPSRLQELTPQQQQQIQEQQRIQAQHQQLLQAQQQEYQQYLNQAAYFSMNPVNYGPFAQSQQQMMMMSPNAAWNFMSPPPAFFNGPGQSPSHPPLPPPDLKPEKPPLPTEPEPEKGARVQPPPGAGKNRRANGFRGLPQVRLPAPGVNGPPFLGVPPIAGRGRRRNPHFFPQMQTPALFTAADLQRNGEGVEFDKLMEEEQPAGPEKLTIFMNNPETGQVQVNKKGKRKPMSTRYAKTKCWLKEEAEAAIALEKEYNRMQKRPMLILKFPDPDLNKYTVRKYSPFIETVHFQQPSTPRYCFVQLKEGADVDAVIASIRQIPFGTGNITCELKNQHIEDHPTSPEEIDPYTLYIGNLPTNISVRVVKQYFPNAQRIDIGYAQRMRYTRYAFIRYSTVAEAMESYKRTVNALLDSRSLIVRFRRQKGNMGLPGETKLTGPAGEEVNSQAPTPKPFGLGQNGLEPDTERLGEDADDEEDEFAERSVKNREETSPTPAAATEPAATAAANGDAEEVEAPIQRPESPVEQETQNTPAPESAEASRAPEPEAPTAPNERREQPAEVAPTTLYSPESLGDEADNKESIMDKVNEIMRKAMAPVSSGLGPREPDIKVEQAEEDNSSDDGGLNVLGTRVKEEPWEDPLPPTPATDDIYLDDYEYDEWEEPEEEDDDDWTGTFCRPNNPWDQLRRLELNERENKPDLSELSRLAGALPLPRSTEQAARAESTAPTASTPPTESTASIAPTTSTAPTTLTAPTATTESTASTAAPTEPTASTASTSATAPIASTSSTALTASIASTASTASTAPSTSAASTSQAAPSTSAASTSQAAASTSAASTSRTGPSTSAASPSWTGPSTSAASTSRAGPSTSAASTSWTGPSTSAASTSQAGPSTSAASTSRTRQQTPPPDPTEPAEDPMPTPFPALLEMKTEEEELYYPSMPAPFPAVLEPKKEKPSTVPIQQTDAADEIPSMPTPIPTTLVEPKRESTEQGQESDSEDPMPVPFLEPKREPSPEPSRPTASIFGNLLDPLPAFFPPNLELKTELPDEDVAAPTPGCSRSVAPTTRVKTEPEDPDRPPPKKRAKDDLTEMFDRLNSDGSNDSDSFLT